MKLYEQDVTRRVIFMSIFSSVLKNKRLTVYLAKNDLKNKLLVLIHKTYNKLNRIKNKEIK